MYGQDSLEDISYLKLKLLEKSPFRSKLDVADDWDQAGRSQPIRIWFGSIYTSQGLVICSLPPLSLLQRARYPN